MQVKFKLKSKQLATKIKYEQKYLDDDLRGHISELLSKLTDVPSENEEDQEKEDKENIVNEPEDEEEEEYETSSEDEENTANNNNSTKLKNNNGKSSNELKTIKNSNKTLNEEAMELT